MLREEKVGSDRWVHYFRFNADGRQIEVYSPSSIDLSTAPFDEAQLDLAVQIKANSGRIDLTSWYTATNGSGAAKGRLESRSVKQGASGTPITLFQREYTSQIENGKTVFPVAKETRFAEDSGSCLLYTSPSPRDQRGSRMPSSA